MKKLSLLLAIGCILSLSAFIIDYNCIELSSLNYHYLTLSEMPSDIQNNSLPLSTITSNFDNMPLSVGLNGQPNNTTDAGAALGRVLFYDVDLSYNHTISCASCHKQEFGFSDSARFSRGFNGELTERNSMGLQHARFHKSVAMFWDLRASSIEQQVTMPIKDEIEMGMTNGNLNGHQWDSIIGRINRKPFYTTLFQSAFGSAIIDSQRITLALAQFVRSINSFGSKYRIGVETTNGNPSVTPFANFTAQENLGKDLFMDITRGNCQACHTRNLFVPQGAQNNGIDGSIFPGQKWTWTAWGTRNDYIGKDSGMAGFKALGRTVPYPGTNWNRDTGRIKANIGRMGVPSLINIGLTAPYMHDGRYKTLDEVINFYSDSVKNNDYNTLSLFLRQIDPNAPGAPNNVQDQLAIDTAPVRIIHYSPTEKAALKAFLLTLTDTTIVNDPKFSDPFCKLGVVSVLFTNPLQATVINDNIEIVWGVDAEINSKIFDVEKSIDGRTFTRIGSLNGRGTATSFYLYKFIDQIPLEGINYYRIKAIDLNGNFTYSRIISTTYKHINLLLYPNPVENILQIDGLNPSDQIYIVNAIGSIVKIFNTPYNMDISRLTPGMYFVKVKNKDNQLVIKKIFKK